MKLILAFLLYCMTLQTFAAPPQAQEHQQLLNAVEEYVLGQLNNQGGQVSVSAGPLDQRMRLAACQQLQPYTPSGARLIGHTSIGLRCLSPARWNIFVPVKVSVESPYVVTAVPLVSGQTLQASDLSVLTGDLGSLPAGVITDPGAAIGKTVRFSLSAGQALRQDQLTAPLVIQQGQSTKLVFHGAGFTATNEGRALNSAAEGQIVQVRTQSGLVVSGIAQTNGTVLVSPPPP